MELDKQPAWIIGNVVASQGEGNTARIKSDYKILQVDQF
jgi:hypothetical protein